MGPRRCRVKAAFSPGNYQLSASRDYHADQIVVGTVTWMMLTTHKLPDNWCHNSQKVLLIVWQRCSSKLLVGCVNQLHRGAQGESSHSSRIPHPSSLMLSPSRCWGNGPEVWGSGSPQLLDQVPCRGSTGNRCHQGSQLTSSQDEALKETSRVTCWAAPHDSYREREPRRESPRCKHTDPPLVLFKQTLFAKWTDWAKIILGWASHHRGRAITPVCSQGSRGASCTPTATQPLHPPFEPKRNFTRHHSATTDLDTGKYVFMLLRKKIQPEVTAQELIF